MNKLDLSQQLRSNPYPGRGIVPYKLFAAFTATGKVFHGRVKPHMVASGYKNKSRAHNVRPLTIRLEHQKFTAFPLPRRRCGRG